MRVAHIIITAAACLLAAATADATQVASAAARRLRATRGELETRLRRLDEIARSDTAGAELRVRVRTEAAAIRTRLTDGDFHVGDRIALAVEGEPESTEGVGPTRRTIEQQLSDTFTLEAGNVMTLPAIGAITLQGVLRSELEAHLTREIGRFIREPVLYARPLIRVSVQGGVTRPGFYSLPVDAVLSDALMAAGGPTQEARLAKLRIEREGKPIWGGPLLRQAIAEGRTLDEMDLRAGDQFQVPGLRGRGAENTLRIIGLVLSIPVTVFTLSKVF